MPCLFAGLVDQPVPMLARGAGVEFDGDVFSIAGEQTATRATIAVQRDAAGGGNEGVVGPGVDGVGG